MPNIIQFRLYLTKLLQKQNSSTFLWFTVYIVYRDTRYALSYTRSIAT